MHVLMALVLAGVGPQDKQDKVIEELSKKIDKVFEGYSERMRKEIDELVRAELKDFKFAPVAAGDAWKDAMTKLAADLKDEGVSGEMKKALATPKHMDAFVQGFSRSGGAPEDILPQFFDKGDDGKFTVKKERERDIQQAIAQITGGAAAPAQPSFGLSIDRDGFTDKDRETLGLKPDMGVRLSKVNPDGPAAKAGLKGGDVIVKVGDNEITRANIGEVLTKKFKPGDKVTIEFLRDGKKESAELTVGQK